MILIAKFCLDVLTIPAIIGLVGKSADFTLEYPVLDPLITEYQYAAGMKLVFNCTLDFESSLISDGIYHYLGTSLVYPYTSEDLGNDTTEVYRDFIPDLEFNFGIGRGDRIASALWLSAYIGNYVGNSLSFLNEIFWQVSIAREKNRSIFKLEVKWKRVAATLGGLAAFQVLLALSALLYCQQNLEIVDDVSTFKYMFGDFPFGSGEERRREDTVRQGKFKFVQEGDGVRWVFATRARISKRPKW